MITWDFGTVSGFVRAWDGASQVQVQLDAAESAATEASPCSSKNDTAATSPLAGRTIRALYYPALIGELELGDRVAVNTNAIRKNLGTGGDGLIVTKLDVPASMPSTSGHLVKARYTPLQVMVNAVDDPDSPTHAAMAKLDSLAGTPVISADLHSSLPAIIAGIRAANPNLNICYVQTDGAALPGWYSRSVHQLKAKGLLQHSVTVGQAFGGDLDAVSIHSGLLAAHGILGTDIIIVTQGPGNLGSDTPFGFSGVQMAEVAHAVAALGGINYAVLRVSQADERARHFGLSHHTSTVYGRLCFTPVRLPVPAAGDDFDTQVKVATNEAIIKPALKRGIAHSVIEVPNQNWQQILGNFPCPMRTMGRDLTADFAAFKYAALAGYEVASKLIK